MEKEVKNLVRAIQDGASYAILGSVVANTTTANLMVIAEHIFGKMPKSGDGRIFGCYIVRYFRQIDFNGKTIGHYIRIKRGRWQFSLVDFDTMQEF